MISLLLMGWLLCSYISYNLYKNIIKSKTGQYGYYEKHGNLAACLFISPVWLIITLILFPYKCLHKEDIEAIAAFFLIFIGSAVLVWLNTNF